MISIKIVLDFVRNFKKVGLISNCIYFLFKIIKKNNNKYLQNLIQILQNIDFK